MASYTTSTIYSLSELSPGEFQIGQGNSDLVYSIHSQNPDATVFSVGETLVLRREDGFQLETTYLGHTDTGVIVKIGTDPYILDTRAYTPGDAITMQADSFPVCFVKGTLVTTSRGQVAIEELVAGDEVRGSTGWRTVKWIGWRHYGPASFLDRNARSRISPVRIRAHAFAENLPDRDLLTSPWHHLFVGGKLVRAMDLVNGTTVVHETGVSDVSYYHIELDQFDVVMAHGVYSESWADGGNRDFFQNADDTSLRPEDKIRRRAPRPGFDHLVLRAGPQLDAIKSSMAERAVTLAGAPFSTGEKHLRSA